ncbi:copper chaperone PCu(A)C [Arenimonas fontis]|uniref:Copper chaperone PCu(A)C n=1 Tax=Arenimonas fontis TaxID=2608255 RepID=A0A5B2ZAK2_9GAMM|nr:copper chaperone PCu(A)C [Arenimonas fontis]KAA2285708.1 copper chaperone PCu(A)C [Arenimonas fontis]
MNARDLCLGFALIALSSVAVAEPGCRPLVERPWVRAAPPGAAALAGYLVLRNPCDAVVEVVDVESLDFGAPMIHRTEEIDGISRMREAGRLVLAPGESLAFEPGGLHLMLMKPLRPLSEGDVVRIRLVLADGRRLYAEYPVRREAPVP